MLRNQLDEKTHIFGLVKLINFEIINTSKEHNRLAMVYILIDKIIFLISLDL